MSHTTSRREFLKFSAAAAASTMIAPQLLRAATPSARPNIVMILVDDLGYGFIGANGAVTAHGDPVSTPNVDALAATGVNFTHGHSRAMCGPTRQCMMTGKSLMRYANPPRNMPFIPHYLRQAGYRTAIAGKWMMGPVYNPNDKGFDEAVLFNGHYEFWDPLVTVFNSGGYLKELNQPSSFDKLPGGEWSPDCIVDDAYGENCATKLNGEFGPDVINRFACDFIERNTGGPFFLYYALKLVHYQPPQLPGSSQPGTYASSVGYMDTLVGQIVKKLESLGIRDNTLIVFAGDNGHDCKKSDEPSIEKGQNCIPGTKGGAKEGATRVPFIANWKAANAQGRICDDLVDMTDVLPTFVAAAGATLPAGETFDGRSFLPQVKGHGGNPREWIYIHAGHHPRPLAEELTGIYATLPAVLRYVVGTRYKLYGDGRFYDLQTDMEETTPIELGTGGKEAEEARKLLQSVLNHYDDRSQWAQDKGFNEPELYKKVKVGAVRAVQPRINTPAKSATPVRHHYDIRGRKVHPRQKNGHFELVKPGRGGNILLH